MRKKLKEVFNISNKGMVQENNWSSSRYQSTLVQRNFLGALCILIILFQVFELFTIVRINTNRTIEPFVIEVERKSGITTLVDPSTIKEYSSQRAVNDYFLFEYLKSRELYDPLNYSFNYYTKIRLMSASKVYDEFLGSLRSANSPLKLYATAQNRDIKIISIQYLQPTYVQIRFSIQYDMQDNSSVNKNRIATISFEYRSLKMEERDRFVNPLGFTITYYKVDDELV